jgi:hypothetical protein
MIQKRRYLSYLLRLWQDSGGDLPSDEPPPWRASLEIPQSGDRLGFASLADLFAFLENETRSASSGSERPDRAASQPPIMPEGQELPIWQAPREPTDKGEEVM